MDTPVDLFVNIWCIDCGYITQVSGSAHVQTCKCERCNSINFEFEKLLSENMKKNLSLLNSQYQTRKK